ncbi:MAG: hypothetical protein Q8O54_12515 [Brevundimonas sp.]|nr:hypothetical protein [Brevundimonas sp.]
MGAIVTVVVLAACGLTSLVMLAAAIRYLSFDEARKTALRSDPGQMSGLSRGEETLRWMAVLGVAAGLFSMPWWPIKGGGMPVLSSDLPGLISWGAVSWLAVAAVLLRRLIYKRWV